MLPKRSIFRARSFEFRTLLGVAMAAACYASAAGQEPGRAIGKGARLAGPQTHGNPGQTHSAGARPQSHHSLHGTPPDFNFHHPLQGEIDRLKAEAKPKPPAKDYDKESLPGKKAMLLDNALQHYRSMFKE